MPGGEIARGAVGEECDLGHFAQRRLSDLSTAAYSSRGSRKDRKGNIIKKGQAVGC